MSCDLYSCPGAAEDEGTAAGRARLHCGLSEVQVCNQPSQQAGASPELPHCLGAVATVVWSPRRTNS